MNKYLIIIIAAILLLTVFLFERNSNLRNKIKDTNRITVALLSNEDSTKSKFENTYSKPVVEGSIKEILQNPVITPKQKKYYNSIAKDIIADTKATLNANGNISTISKDSVFSDSTKNLKYTAIISGNKLSLNYHYTTDIQTSFVRSKDKITVFYAISDTSASIKGIQSFIIPITKPKKYSKTIHLVIDIACFVAGGLLVSHILR